MVMSYETGRMSSVPTGTGGGSLSVGEIVCDGDVRHVYVRFATSPVWVQLDGSNDVADPANQAPLSVTITHTGTRTRLRITYGPTVQAGTFTFGVKVTNEDGTESQTFSLSVTVYDGTSTGLFLQGSAAAGNFIVVGSDGAGGWVVGANPTSSGTVTVGGTTYTRPVAVSNMRAIIRIGSLGQVMWVRWLSPGTLRSITLGGDGNYYVVNDTTTSAAPIAYGANGAAQVTLSKGTESAAVSMFKLRPDGTWLDGVVLASNGSTDGPKVVGTEDNNHPVVLTSGRNGSGVTYLRVGSYTFNWPTTYTSNEFYMLWLDNNMLPGGQQRCSPVVSSPTMIRGSRSVWVRTTGGSTGLIGTWAPGASGYFMARVGPYGVEQSFQLPSAGADVRYVHGHAAVGDKLYAFWSKYSTNTPPNFGNGVTLPASDRTLYRGVLELTSTGTPLRAAYLNDGTVNIGSMYSYANEIRVNISATEGEVYGGVTVPAGSTAHIAKFNTQTLGCSWITGSTSQGVGNDTAAVSANGNPDQRGVSAYQVNLDYTNGSYYVTTLTLRNGDGSLAPTITRTGTADNDMVISLSADGTWGSGTVATQPPPGSIEPSPPEWLTTDWPAAAQDGAAVSGILSVTNVDAETQADVPEPQTSTNVVQPGSVADLTAAVASGALGLSWQPVVGATSFRIYELRSYTGTYIAVRRGETTATSYTVLGLVNGQTARLGVSSVTGQGEGPITEIEATPSASAATPGLPSFTWTAMGIRVREAGSSTWHTSSFSIPTGTVTVVQDDAAPAGQLPDLSALVAFAPTSATYAGTLRLEAQAVAFTAGGDVLYSTVVPLETVYTTTGGPPPTPPMVTPGSFDGIEDVIVSTTCTSDVAAVWELESTTAMSTDSPGTVAGTVSIISGQGTSELTLRLVPAANWNGAGVVRVRASSSGGTSEWADVLINISPVADAPSAPVPTTFSDVPEDGYLDHVLLLPDVDMPMAGSGSWTLEISDQQTGPWRSDRLVTPNAIFEIIDSDSGDQASTVRIQPVANYNGALSFWARVRDESDSPTLYSVPTLISGQVVAVDDAPTAPVPNRMPLARPSITPVSQEFRSSDPDGPGPYTWQMAASATGPWSSSLTLAGIGQLAVAAQDDTHLSATVTYTPQLTAGPARYRFWLRVVDGSGVASPATMVTGSACGPELSAWLQRLVRTSSGASIVPLCPLTTITALSFSESLDGPGGASLTVSAAEVARRSQQLGISMDSLLDPSSVEVVVRAGLTDVWCGPVTEYTADVGSGVVSIEARGLMGYLEAREIETARTYTNDDLSSEIAWGLVAAEQAKAYGSLLLTNGTTPVGQNGSFTFEASSTLAAALQQVSETSDGPELWIDHDRTFRAASARGSDKRASVLITGGQVLRANRAVRDELVSTVVIVDGDQEAGSPPAQGTAVDTAAMATRGRMVRRISAPNLMTSTACQALAQQILDASKTPTNSYRISVSVDPARPVAAADLSAGDVVRVAIEDELLGMVQEDVRIVSKRVQVVSADAVTVELDVETARFLPSGAVMGRFAKGRWTPQVIEGLYDALYRS